MLKSLAGLVVLAACGGGNPPDTEHPKGADAKQACEAMADHVVGLMVGDLPGGSAGEQPTDVIDKISRVLVDRCFSDHWTIDATKCFATSASQDAMMDCAPLLTVPQRDALAHGMDEAFPK